MKTTCEESHSMKTATAEQVDTAVKDEVNMTEVLLMLATIKVSGLGSL